MSKIIFVLALVVVSGLLVDCTRSDCPCDPVAVHDTLFMPGDTIYLITNPPTVVIDTLYVDSFEIITI